MYKNIFLIVALSGVLVLGGGVGYAMFQISQNKAENDDLKNTISQLETEKKTIEDQLNTAQQPVIPTTTPSIVVEPTPEGFGRYISKTGFSFIYPLTTDYDEKIHDLVVIENQDKEGRGSLITVTPKDADDTIPDLSIRVNFVSEGQSVESYLKSLIKIDDPWCQIETSYETNGIITYHNKETPNPSTDMENCPPIYVHVNPRFPLKYFSFHIGHDLVLDDSEIRQTANFIY